MYKMYFYSDLHRAVIEYAQRDLAVFPLSPRTKVPRYSDNNVKIARYFLCDSVKVLYSSED